MYYGLGTGGRCSICPGQTLHVHSPGGNTFMPEMNLWAIYYKYDIKWKTRLKTKQQIGIPGTEL